MDGWVDGRYGVRVDGFGHMVVRGCGLYVYMCDNNDDDDDNTMWIVVHVGAVV